MITGNDYDLILRGGGGVEQSLNNYKHILNTAKSLLESCDIRIDNYFPFLEYGDQFLFVYLDEGEDPPVYRFELELFYCGDDYIPGSSIWGYPKGVSKISDSFSKMINDIVKSKLENNK